MSVALSDYLVVSALLFGVGVYGLVTKRNAMRLVFAVEILVNAANINFIAFNRYLWPTALGQTAVLLSIAIAAGEASVILAIIVAAYRIHDDVDVAELKTLKE
jgi:NAD(P)H-quinone oxidoreductase subunit 4L